jgi:hypothetical protein
MYLRHESANLTLPLSEMELPKELESASVAAPRPAAWAMVGHRPVLHCDAGVSTLPPSDHVYPAWMEEELLDLKLVGA